MGSPTKGRIKYIIHFFLIFEGRSIVVVHNMHENVALLNRRVKPSGTRVPVLTNLTL